MSASEVLMREQLDRLIARAELRVEQHCIYANALMPYGDQAKSARDRLAPMLVGLAKLKTFRKEFSEPQPSQSRAHRLEGVHEKPRCPLWSAPLDLNDAR